MPRRGRPDPDKKSALPTLEPDTKCNGIKRDGCSYCTQPAGAGTDHLGQGRCKLHGGKNPVKHGRYSTTKRQALLALIEEEDANPLDVIDDIKILRALGRELAEDGTKNVDAAHILAEATKAADRVERARAQNAVSRIEFNRVMAEMGRTARVAIETHLTGKMKPKVIAALLAEINRAWLSIHVA